MKLHNQNYHIDWLLCHTAFLTNFLLSLPGVLFMFFGKKDQYWLFWQRHCCYFHFTLITDNIWQSRRRGFTRFFFFLSFQKSAAAQRTESVVVQCTLQFNEKNSRSVSIVVLQIPCHPLGFDEIFSISFFNWCNIIVPIIFSEFSIQWCFHEIFCCSQVATTTKTTLPFFTITDGSLIERTVARRWRRRRASELMFSHTWQARDAHIM